MAQPESHIEVDLSPARRHVKRAQRELDAANRELARQEARLSEVEARLAASYGIKVEDS